VTDRKQELCRQFRFVRRNRARIENLVRLRANLPIDPQAHTRLLHQRAKLRAKVLAHRQNEILLSEAHHNAVILSEAKDLQFAAVNHNSGRERPKEASPSARATGASARAASTAVHCLREETALP
jgi:hypothetical protein